MNSAPIAWHSSGRLCLGTTLAAMLACAMILVLLVAPEEITMGNVQRIVYLHVSVAWWGLSAFIATGLAGVGYLMRRSRAWDQAAQALAETGWLCSSLTLITGSLWAHEAWNTWWTWEPRLTASLVLWMLYGGYFLVRSSLEDPERRARVSSVLAIVGMVDVPLVIMATRWFRGIHPVTPEMDPRMRGVLLFSVVTFAAFLSYVTYTRWRQLRLEERFAQALEWPEL